MSSQNAFPGPNGGRPAVRPTTQTGGSQPSWVNPQTQPQTGRPQQPTAWPPQQQVPQQQPAQGYPNYPQQGYGAQQADPQQGGAYGQWSELQTGNRDGTAAYPPAAQAGQPDPYAPQFEPYVPPSRQGFSQGQQPRSAPGYGMPPQQQPQQSPQWGRQPDPHGYDAGNYGTPAYQQPAPTFGQQQYHDNELSAADWAGPHDSFGHDGYQQHGDPHLGFGQAEGGELEPAYNEDDGEYEEEDDAPRGRRPLMILAALVGAIVIGGGMAYGYKKFGGAGVPEGNPPVVKSDDFAAKTKPADAGGKQFPYSDTKIMGRLGDGTSTASADEANAAPQAPPSDNSSSSADDNGARKVSTLVVGRDGSIMPPAAPTGDEAPPPQQGGTGVPGTSLVDFGRQQGSGAPPPETASVPDHPQSADAAEDTPPPKKSKPVKIATINSVDSSDNSGGDSSADTPPPVKKKLKKVARAEPTVESDASDPPPVASPHGSGFVAVLASVPHSASSRIDALKRFADMQQKYSTALAGKTPDIASANLAKGAYDRLVVGPPGSRQEASNVCAQLKAEGYQSCWVTAY
ncbi:MAG: SPOR domain-containing protein [Hyphomicrobium sp.]